jgi:acetyl esterase/lipase
MAAVVSLMAKDRGGPDIRFQALLWPVTDAYFDTPSYHEYAEGRFLTRNMMQWFWDNYTTDANERAEIYASPLRGMTEELRGLPPALVQTAGNDVLRDEGEEYAGKLDAAGVDVIAVRYSGMIHDWGLLNPISQVPATRASLLQVAEELKRRLR